MTPFTDGCPKCTRRGTRPLSTRRVNATSILARYRCVCGNTWTCSWLIEAGRTRRAA